MINTDLFNQATDINENTKQNYIKRANTLNKKLRENNIKIIQHRRVINFIKKEWENPNSQNNYITIMIKYFDLSAKTHLKIYGEYKDLVNKNILDKTVIIKKEVKEVDYETGIEKFTKEITEDVDNKNTILESLLITALYLLQAPRRNDYWNMIFTTNRENIKDNINYLLRENGEYIFIFNVFKTKKSFGTQEIKVKKKLLNDILDIKDYKEGERIYKKSTQSVANDLKNETKHFFGVEMGINDIRKMVSLQFKDSINDVMTNAWEMGHSLATKRRFYIS